MAITNPIGCACDKKKFDDQNKNETLTASSEILEVKQRLKYLLWTKNMTLNMILTFMKTKQFYDHPIEKLKFARFVNGSIIE